MTNFSLNGSKEEQDDSVRVLVVVGQMLADAYEGRVKPDNKGDKGTIRESLDNMPFIKMLQTKIGKILDENIKDYE